MGFLPWSDDSCRTYRYWRGNVLYFLGEQWTKPAGCGGCIEDFTAVPIYPGCILSQYKDRLSTSHCFRQIVQGFKWWLSRINMFAILCLVMFSGPAFTPNSALNNPFNQKQPGVCCYFIILTSYETNLKPTHGNGNMSSFVPLKLTSKVTQVSLNVSLVAFWALLMDHGVWFFDSWTSGDCCERRSKPGIQQPKRWIQQPKFFNNQKNQQPTDSAFWLSNSTLMVN